MEFKFLNSGSLETEITPTESENRLLRAAIRKQLLAAATGQTVLHHDAAATLIHYIDETGDEPSQIQSVQCARRHIGFFKEAVESAMRDLSDRDIEAAAQLVRALNEAETEIEAKQVGLVIPDFLPENL